MQKHKLKEFSRELSWSSKMYLLLAISLIAFGLMTDVGTIGWTPAMLFALCTILTVEVISLFFRRHPKTLSVIWWIFLFVLLSLFLIGFKS